MLQQSRVIKEDPLEATNRGMPTASFLFTVIVTITGVSLIGFSVYTWQSADSMRFFAYLFAVSMTALMRIRVPDLDGTYSLTSLYLLLAMAVCSFSELVMLGLAAALVQETVRRGPRPEAAKALFRVCSLVIALMMAYYPSRAVATSEFRVLLPLALTISSGLIYVAYTFLMSGDVCLREHVPYFKVCDQWLLWTFGYHLLGTAVAILLSVDPHVTEWQLPLPVLPLAYVLYYYYRAYVDRQLK